MEITKFNELFTTNENMQSRTEIEDEIMNAKALMAPEPDLSRDDAIDDMSGIVDHYSLQGYIDALKWVLGDGTRLNAEDYEYYVENKACDACAGQPIKGVLYPVAYESAQEVAPSKWGFVERCDMCGIYDNDIDACKALARHLGSPIRHFNVEVLGRTQPAVYTNAEKTTISLEETN